MTRDDIIRMAREAGMPSLSLIDIGYLEKFSALVEAAECERCIEACETSYQRIDGPEGWLRYAVDAIRARGNA